MNSYDRAMINTIMRQVKYYESKGYKFERDIKSEISRLDRNELRKLRAGGGAALLSEYSAGYLTTDRQGREYLIDVEEVSQLKKMLARERGLRSQRGLSPRGNMNVTKYEGFEKLRKGTERRLNPGYYESKMETWKTNFEKSIKGALNNSTGETKKRLQEVYDKINKTNASELFRKIKNEAGDLEEIYYPKEGEAYLAGKEVYLRKIEKAVES